ncbi:hypothetical protein, partial [Streptomyces albidoflavus]|uniref:hypothetical protein n=1 Tax=Streptomyces albidoflavus TaxID=1886 RepID=UPI0011410CEE
MSLAQLHHTSSGPGLAAVSPGVPPGIRKAAEHLFGYVPPRGTPPHTAAPAQRPRTGEGNALRRLHHRSPAATCLCGDLAHR